MIEVIILHSITSAICLCLIALLLYSLVSKCKKCNSITLLKKHYCPMVIYECEWLDHKCKKDLDAKECGEWRRKNGYIGVWLEIGKRDECACSHHWKFIGD